MSKKLGKKELDSWVGYECGSANGGALKVCLS